MGDAGDSQPAPRGTQPPQSIASSPQFSPLLAAPVRAVPDPTVPCVGPPLSATVSDRCPQHALTGRPNPPDVVATSQQHTQHSTARSVGRTRSARARLLTGRSTADGSEHSRSKTPHQGREHSNVSRRPRRTDDSGDGLGAVPSLVLHDCSPRLSSLRCRCCDAPRTRGTGSTMRRMDG